uniref:Methyltransferase n=1 Tax=Zea mays TaxID=4577 RepID=A0A804UDF7_MAIZE
MGITQAQCGTNTSNESYSTQPGPAEPQPRVPRRRVQAVAICLVRSTKRRFNCLIPPQHGYKVPIKWPKSRDVVWKANIPHTHLAKEKSDQNWMVEAGEKIKFPGGGTHFHHGADKYISNIANILNFKDNNINNEGMLRIVLDVGCGVASFGGYLLSSNVIAMSLAPNDVHQNQI